MSKNIYQSMHRFFLFVSSVLKETIFVMRKVDKVSMFNLTIFYLFICFYLFVYLYIYSFVYSIAYSTVYEMWNLEGLSFPDA
jgi:hypothetical protein